MTEAKVQLAVVVRQQTRVGVARSEIAARAGVTVAFVDRLVRQGILEPVDQCGQVLPAEATLTVRRLARLKADLGVNPEGGTVILTLLERIEKLERDNAALRAWLRSW